MQSNIGIKFNNKYHIELIDSITGKVKQSGDFHNIHLKNFWNFILGNSSDNSSFTPPSTSVYNLGYVVSLGSGTTEPKFENTALASRLWASSSSSTSTEVYPANVTYEWLDDFTLCKKETFTFPATSAYVGNVTEIGLGCMAYNSYASRHQASNAVYTRALLTDSEGQVISFNKTDLDILVVSISIELSLISNSETFKIVRQCKFLEYILGKQSSVSAIVLNLGYPTLIRYTSDRNVVSTLPGTSVWSSASGVTAHASLSGHNGSYTYATYRLPATEVTAQTFFNAIAIPSLGYWELPNESIFPAYTIKDISIGTGDGTTTDFINPLNYFKKHTEKIYKNGTLLSRDIDYTINHMGNKDCKPEVAQLYPIKKVSAAIDIASYMGQYDISAYSLIWPSAVAGTLKTSDMENSAKCFSNNAPLYIEYEEEVTMNCLKCSGGLRGLSSSGGYSDITTGTLFYLDYSTDGETYVEIDSVATTTTPASFVIDFPDTTAKYWRIRTNYSRSVVGINVASNYLTLQRKDPYITFTQAPAEGDVLTMDVDMDLIMKNSNFVVDVNCTINFTI